MVIIMLDYLVLYASESGNTRLVADEIFTSIKSPKKKLVNIREWNGRFDARTYFVGYWANRGSCSLEIIDLLSSLHHKNVALFGTCGLGNTNAYYEQIAESGALWLAADNTYLGSYFCQGKMHDCIKDKYEMLRERCGDDKVEMLLANFETAKSHPNRDDLMRANMFVDEIETKLKKA